MLVAGRELDIRIAREVWGHQVIDEQSEYWEVGPGVKRLLPHYSLSMSAAWEIVERCKITLIPIHDGTWFAMAGKRGGWQTPAEFVDYLGKGEYVTGGAAVDHSPALSVCLAALTARAKTHPELRVISGSESDLCH